MSADADPPFALAITGVGHLPPGISPLVGSGTGGARTTLVRAFIRKSGVGGADTAAASRPVVRSQLKPLDSLFLWY